jgi:uncharacterized damage-inducible protein DinB
MNQITFAAEHILTQLKHAVTEISESDFTKHSTSLNSSVGQHLRHTLEFFICLQHGYDMSVVSYDKRAHSTTLESDKHIALHTIHEIQHFVSSHPQDKALTLEVGYMPDSDHCEKINTTFFRELTYNVEHAVHHMALMKIGLREVADYVKVPSDFGIAVSTLRHRNTATAAH